jgi:hypothetical protein
MLRVTIVTYLKINWQYIIILPCTGCDMQPWTVFTSFAITEQMLALGKYLYGWTVLD